MITPNLKSAKPRICKRGGFTLIEIMIVVCLLAILFTVSIPNYTEARRKAKLHACCRNLISIATAITMLEIETGPICTSLQKSSTNILSKTTMGKQLKKKGYLEVIPICPESGSEYTIELNSPSQIVHPSKAGISQPGTWKMWCTSKLHGPNQTPHYYSWYGLTVK